MVPKTVLITGARGGLGEALTHEFRENGWHVIATDLKEKILNNKNPVPGSLLTGPFEKFSAQAHKEIGKTIEPAEVAKYIFRIANAKKTKAVYKIHNSFRLSIASMLPFCLIERIVYHRLK